MHSFSKVYLLTTAWMHFGAALRRPLCEVGPFVGSEQYGKWLEHGANKLPNNLHRYYLHWLCSMGKIVEDNQWNYPSTAEAKQRTRKPKTWPHLTWNALCDEITLVMIEKKFYFAKNWKRVFYYTLSPSQELLGHIEGTLELYCKNGQDFDSVFVISKLWRYRESNICQGHSKGCFKMAYIFFLWPTAEEKEGRYVGWFWRRVTDDSGEGNAREQRRFKSAFRCYNQVKESFQFMEKRGNL